jgi:proteasome lid subunit RPN8/RPN11
MVTLPRSIYDAMLAHVREGYPNEACGVLASDGQRIVKHYPARNAAEEPATFSIIDGPDLLRIWDEIESHEWMLLAYYHSHPRTPAYPSPRDIQYAQGWPGTYYLIFTLMGPAAPVLRAFLIDGETVTEHEIALTGE